MGRGRQKAKQTKVARQLKYFSPDTDYDALQRELATGGSPGNGHGREAALDDAEDSGDEAEDDEAEDDEAEAEDDDEYADWNARGGR